MHSFLFINPFSGKYDKSQITTVIQRLHEAGLSPMLCTLSPNGDGAAVIQNINASNERALVIVAAGDGTVNAVVNALDPGAATLAVLPMGTSNVLAAELGIRSVANGVDRIIAGKSKELSVGVIEQGGTSRRFVLMAGIGFDGAVVRDVSLQHKQDLKQGAYAVSALKNALKWDTELIEIKIGDRKIACHSVIFCNASRYGGNFTLAADCSVFSPGLTAICVQKNSRSGYLRLALALFLGRAASSKSLLRIPLSECEILGSKPVQIDGDFIGNTPARLNSLADFARIIV
jgi:diacylglycerol kinase family enzyme